MTRAAELCSDTHEISNLTRLAALEEENRVIARRLRGALFHNRELVELAIASHKLHEARTRRDVLGAVETMFANLLGVIDLAVMEIDGSELRLLTALGAGARFGRITLREGLIGRAIDGGKPYVAGARAVRATHIDRQLDLDLEVAAVIPLAVGGGVIAVVIALRPTGEHREPPNAELLELTSRQAALAVWSSALEPPPSVRTTRRLP